MIFSKSETFSYLSIASVLLSLSACSTAQVSDPDIYGTLEPFASKSVYFVVTDRFVDGDPDNNYPEQGGEYATFDVPVGDAEVTGANIGYLGGDFKGILDHADYIREMGFSALWITPVVSNPDQAFRGGDKLGESFFADHGKTGYHGYWANNFYTIDEHLVSQDLSFSRLSERLEEAGLSLVLDIVANHGSPAFTMPEVQPGFGVLYDQQGNLVADHGNLEPEDLDHANPLQQWFHREKDIAQLSNLNENNPKVVDYLVGSYLHWIDQGAKAFRIDTIKHMPHSFWKTMSDRVRTEHPGFFMFAESFSYDAEQIAQHTLPENGGISVLDFPGRQAMIDVFEQPDSDYSRMLDYLHLKDGIYHNPYELMTFYDNHDMARMNASDTGFIDAHNWLFTSRGIPVVYYGSETGFMRGAKEHYGNRNYFGAERIESAKSHPIRQQLIPIAQLREKLPALQRGVQVNLDFAGHTATFLRIYQYAGESQTALVLLNKGDEEATVNVNRFLNRGVWTEALSGTMTRLDESNPDLSARLPAHSVQVWVNNEVVSAPELLEYLATHQAE